MMMAKVKFYFRAAMLVSFLTSNYVYAICEENSNYYTSAQSIFGYVSRQEDKWLLLDSSYRLYTAAFQNETMTLEKMDSFEESSFFKSKILQVFQSSPEAWWSDNRRHLQKIFEGDIRDYDVIFNLSASNSEMTLFAGDFPQYVVVTKNSGIHLLNWQLLDNADHILGSHSVGETFLVLVVHDEKVHFIRSTNGYSWEKSDFVMSNFVKGYTFNDLFWVVDGHGEIYSSADGLNWRRKLNDQKFNQYLKDYDTYREGLIGNLIASNYIINAIDGDHHEGVIVGWCSSRIDTKLQKVGFLLHYKNNRHTLYESFNNKKPLRYAGKIWAPKILK